MNKQMTNLKRITEAREGLVIQHKLASADESYNFEATLCNIYKAANTIDVIVQNKNGYAWSETWDLAHTNSALRSGEYIVVADNISGEPQ